MGAQVGVSVRSLCPHQAKRGRGLAQLQLKRLYRAGVGVREDHVKAYIWLSLAADQEVSGAGIARDAVATLPGAAMKTRATSFVMEFSYSSDRRQRGLRDPNSQLDTLDSVGSMMPRAQAVGVLPSR